jgi:dolichol-phosphate mannosyltransferase
VSATVEHLYVELRLHGIEHEIVVVDDGSADGTWMSLQEAIRRVPTLHPIRNIGEHGFGILNEGWDAVFGSAAAE